MTCHIPSILKWPGLEPQTFNGLQYHLDVAATVVDLAGLRIPSHWDGESVAKHVREGNDAGREFLVLSQGAWSCQRSVRWDDYLYMRTWHDGFHGHWNEEMLFDITNDPHEQDDLFLQQTLMLPTEGRCFQIGLRHNWKGVIALLTLWKLFLRKADHSTQEATYLNT